jgi:trigger factor
LELETFYFMKTELVDVSSVHKEIKIEIDPAEIKPVYDQVIQRYTKLATVPGFRKGYAPRDIVKMRYREEIQSDVLRDLLPNRVTEAIQEHSLQPLSEPQLHIENAENLDITKNSPLELHVHVEVMPVLEDPNYKGLEGVRRVRPVNEEEVEQMIEGRRQEQASLTPVEDRAAEIGDTVTIDIDGTFADDPEADPIHVEDLSIDLGGEGVQQEFTDNLVGVNPDDVKTFTVEYPADFTSPGLAGRKLEYTATVKSVGRIELPELNDEFAQSLSEGEQTYESLADLRTKLRQDMETFAKMEADNRLRDELMNKLIDANAVEVPPTLTNYQAQGLARQFASRMQEQGMDMRQADDRLWQMLFQRMLPQAEREVRGALLLDKIAQVENVEITPEEVSAEIENIAKFAGRSPDEVRDILAREEGGENGITERFRNRKAMEILVNNAAVTEGEWQEEQPEEQPIELSAEETTETLQRETENETTSEGETAKA